MKVKRPYGCHCQTLMWGVRNLQLKHMSQGFCILEGPRGHFQNHCLGFSCGECAHFQLQEETKNWSHWRRPGHWDQWWAGLMLLQAVDGGPDLYPVVWFL